MDAREKYRYWQELAKYDLETAKVMHKGGRYVYVVFMCQQAIEKITKGIFVLHVGREAPMTHNIWNIFKQLKRQIVIEDRIEREEFEKTLTRHKNYFVKLLSFYISGRYPSYKESVVDYMDKNKAEEIFAKTEEVFKWIESLSQLKE